MRPLIASLSLICALLAVQPVSAQQGRDILAAWPAATVARLVEPEIIAAQLVEDGAARVLVEFALDERERGSPDFDLTTREGVAAHNARINEIQTRILDRVLPRPVAGGVAAPDDPELGLFLFESSPLIAVNADDDLLRAFAEDREVLRIHPDLELSHQLTDSVPLIGGGAARTVPATGEGQTVVILDDGVNRNHEFLSDNLVLEACFNVGAVAAGGNRQSFCPFGDPAAVGPGSSCTRRAGQDCNHGTHVASIAAGQRASPGPGNPAFAVAPDADLIGINVFHCPDGTAQSCSADIRSFQSDVIAALDHVFNTLRFDHDIAAINISIGSATANNTVPCTTAAARPVIQILRVLHIATVVSAGNSGQNNGVGGPYACIPETIAVASTTKDDQRSVHENWGSNWGALVDLAAPGSSIRAARGTDDTGYRVTSGTSMAAPHVAGAIAVLRGILPDATVTDFETALRETGTGVTEAGRTHPRINLGAALRELGVEIGTETTLSASGGMSYFEGQTPTLRARVTSADLVPPSGEVTFRRGDEILSTTTINAQGEATHQLTPPLPVGTYHFTAEYGGSPGFPASTSSVLTLVINPLHSTTTVVEGPDSGAPGQPLSVTATVTANAGLPTGAVSFARDGSALGTRVLGFDGEATLQVDNLSEGVHLIWASYPGTNSHAPSESNFHVVTIADPSAMATTTTLTGPESSVSGQSVSFTAEVSASGATPTGSVSFRRGASIDLATIALNADGRAVFTTDELMQGIYEIRARYNPEDGLAGSISEALRHEVAAAPPNDLFVNRIVLPGQGTTSGLNFGASAEPGQPSIAVRGSTNAVWWAFTPNWNGRVIIDTQGSDFNTTLAVFIGSRPDALSLVAANDNWGRGPHSRVEFEARAGTQYQIAVAGMGNATGNIRLNLRLAEGNSFSGGGVIFEHSAACRPLLGETAQAVIVHYTPSELGGRPSGVSLVWPEGAEHLALWGAMEASRDFFGGAGRQSWSRFVFYPTRPLIRVVRRQVTAPSRAELEAAQELILRLRVQHFGAVEGCAVTVAASLRRDCGRGAVPCS